MRIKTLWSATNYQPSPLYLSSIHMRLCVAFECLKRIEAGINYRPTAHHTVFVLTNNKRFSEYKNTRNMEFVVF